MELIKKDTPSLYDVEVEVKMTYKELLFMISIIRTMSNEERAEVLYNSKVFGVLSEEEIDVLNEYAISGEDEKAINSMIDVLDSIKGM